MDSTLYDLGINRFANLALEFKYVKVYFPTNGELEELFPNKDAETGIISL
jgi:hypothetical protein